MRAGFRISVAAGRRICARPFLGFLSERFCDFFRQQLLTCHLSKTGTLPFVKVLSLQRMDVSKCFRRRSRFVPAAHYDYLQLQTSGTASYHYHTSQLVADEHYHTSKSKMVEHYHYHGSKMVEHYHYPWLLA